MIVGRLCGTGQEASELHVENTDAGVARNSLRRSSVASHQFDVARQDDAARALAVQLGLSTPAARRPARRALRRGDQRAARADDQRVGGAQVLAARDRRSAPMLSVTAMSCWRMPGMPV